jgi:hypothetical protein
MSERALKTTAHLEEGWHVEWTGWKLSSSWPIKVGTWWCSSQDKKYYIQSRCFVGDDQKDSSVLGHAKDESRLRLRIYILEHQAMRER